MPVIFHRLAAAEYVAARRWYARRSTGAEVRFVSAVEAAVQLIDQNPSAGTAFHGPYRWVRVRRFPYQLYFGEVQIGTAVVFAVAHSRRRPGYWRGRPNRP
jgi:plasmid stabilization system protein ParE